MSAVNLKLLTAIANANAANTVVYVSQADGLPLVQHKPPLISVDGSNKDPEDESKIAAHVTDDGVKLLAAKSNAQNKSAHVFSVESGGFERPKAKRRGNLGGGAPTKYPFDTMDVGAFFFVANSDVEKGNAFKTMSSAVGSANQRFAELTGEKETVKRAKRGPDHKAIKGPDGKNVMETVTVEKKKFTKKFVVSQVETGKTYGAFTAPSDGAVVMRIAVD